MPRGSGAPRHRAGPARTCGPGAASSGRPGGGRRAALRCRSARPVPAWTPARGFGVASGSDSVPGRARRDRRPPDVRGSPAVPDGLGRARRGPGGAVGSVAATRSGSPSRTGPAWTSGTIRSRRADRPPGTAWWAGPWSPGRTPKTGERSRPAATSRPGPGPGAASAPCRGREGVPAAGCGSTGLRWRPPTDERGCRSHCAWPGYPVAGPGSSGSPCRGRWAPPAGRPCDAAIGFRVSSGEPNGSVSGLSPSSRDRRRPSRPDGGAGSAGDGSAGSGRGRGAPSPGRGPCP